MKVSREPTSLSESAATPDAWAMTSFFVRTKGLQARRVISNAFSRPPRLSRGVVAEFPDVVAESISPLRTSGDPREQSLLLGKIENLRIACRRINQRVLFRDQVFSFWRQIGPPWRIVGYEVGREVREGCVIPTRGGGLCQLSGSLLEVATAINCDLLERHRHTALPADVPHDARRDATIFWNYVDLRFRAPAPVLVEAYLTEESLVVKLRANEPLIQNPNPFAIMPPTSVGTKQSPNTINASCFTCNQGSCFRHPVGPKLLSLGHASKTAFLIDEAHPEFQRYVSDLARDGDQIFAQSSICDRENEVGFRRHPFRLRRALKLRLTVARKLTLAKAHFELGETLAKMYSRQISYAVEHVCVSQTLLPHLWRLGLLGGRTFDVLMSRLPVSILEKELDKAAQLYPENKTLAEFRAPRWFAEAEAEALLRARTVVTPHPQIAKLFPDAKLLDWQLPDERQAGAVRKKKDLIVFFGPTLARKGAHAVREVVKQMGLKLSVVGAELEGDEFWHDLPVTHETAKSLCWERIHTVLQPALFEFWPRHLLRARALGSRLVISPFSGFEEDRSNGIYHVNFGNVAAIISTMKQILETREGSLTVR